MINLILAQLIFKRAIMKKTTLYFKLQLFAFGLLAFLQGQSQTVTFNYTGGVQTYTVPVGVTSLTVDVYGAQGGFGYNVPNVTPGLGGRVQATLAVTPGEVLNIYVGGQGGPGGTTVGGTAGYNGGGTGGGWPGGRSGGGGGGASDIRQGGTALSNRVVIGSGGGGTGVNHSSGDAGGNGGGLTGSNGLTGTYLGGGATQSAGGTPNGILGAGGNAPNGQTGGGGGGGYYGGGASAWEGGGGGSSYTAPSVTGVTHTAGARTGNGQITITVPCATVSVTTLSQTNVFCFSGSNGAASVSAAGGAGFTYDWTPGNPTGDGTASVTGLTAGTYTCTVTNACGSSATHTVNITQPSALTVTGSQTNVSCNAGNNGTASVVVSGGASSYTYAWTPSISISSNAAALTAGGYTCTITDINGCSITQTFTITEPSAIVTNTNQVNVSCNGGVNGSALVTLSGGTPNYSYSWAPSGGTSSIATGLGAGTYTCTITDANGCTATPTVAVTEPSALTVNSSTGVIACHGDSTTVVLTASGGTGPYSGDGTFAIAAGSHTFTVTDANNCPATVTFTVTEPSAINASVLQTNLNCFGDSTGTIDLTVTGGTGAFSFDWNNGAFNTEDISGLTAGSYAVLITDVNGCEDSTVVVISQPTALSTSTVTTNPTTCGGAGLIDLSISGGTPTYSYLWTNSATTEDITTVAGSYSCTVTDANGCTIFASASLSDPAAPVVTVSFTIDTVCVTDGSYTLSGGLPAGGTYSGPGVTGSFFSPSAANNGAHTITYTYTDSQTGCTASNTDMIVVDACVGVNTTNAIQQQFVVFPNPNNGTFVLQLNTTETVDVMIYDAVGQLISANKVSGNVQHSITIETAGVYLISVVTNDGTISSQRVIISK
jgi:large repetitive protein